MEQMQQVGIEQSVNEIYHRYISKENDGIYKCPVEGCHKSYSSMESLNRHMTRHSTNKEHVCKYCGKAFLRRSECEIHMRIHTGEKPFKCDICGKAFARQTDLKIHKAYHSDEKPFECPFAGCGYRFKRKSDVKKHLRVHLKRSGGKLTELKSSQSAFVSVDHKYIKHFGSIVIYDQL